MVSLDSPLTKPFTLHSIYAVLLTACAFVNVAAANGEEAKRGASSADIVWYHRGELAGKPNSKRVPQSLLPCAAGYTLPGCWTGTVFMCLITGDQYYVNDRHRSTRETGIMTL